MRAGAVAFVGILAACGLVTLPAAPEPPAEGGPRMSFTIPDGWSRLGKTTLTHYFTTGDPDICDGIVGSCDPSKYVMERDTMDVSVEEFVDATLCTEELRPTWEGRTEDRPSPMREATYRLVWLVCVPEGLEGVRIAADIRAGDLQVRDGLLAELRAFIESFVLIEGGATFVPGA